jgi:hypothetical protein
VCFSKLDRQDILLQEYADGSNELAVVTPVLLWKNSVKERRTHAVEEQ